MATSEKQESQATLPAWERPTVREFEVADVTEAFFGGAGDGNTGS